MLGAFRPTLGVFNVKCSEFFLKDVLVVLASRDRLLWHSHPLALGDPLCRAVVYGKNTKQKRMREILKR